MLCCTLPITSTGRTRTSPHSPPPCPHNAQMLQGIRVALCSTIPSFSSILGSDVVKFLGLPDLRP